MKHRSRHSVLLGAVALLPLVAWAADPAAEPKAPASAPASTPKAEKKDRCEPVSGSRIKSTRGGGCPGAGQMTRSYTRRDIEITGEIDMAEALRKLDPIFR
jgi:hypothetical protein